MMLSTSRSITSEDPPWEFIRPGPVLLVEILSALFTKIPGPLEGAWLSAGMRCHRR